MQWGEVGTQDKERRQELEDKIETKQMKVVNEMRQVSSSVSGCDRYVHHHACSLTASVNP